MRKNTNIIRMGCLIGIMFILILAYKSLNKRDFNNVNQKVLTKSVESPDGRWMVRLYMVGEKGKLKGKVGHASYIYAKLFQSPVYLEDEEIEWNDKYSKIIYWKKDCKAEDVVWIGNKVVLINGIKLNINKEVYDCGEDEPGMLLGKITENKKRN